MNRGRRNSKSRLIRLVRTIAIALAACLIALPAAASAAQSCDLKTHSIRPQTGSGVSVPYDTEANGLISPHGHLIEVQVDVVSMWRNLPNEQRATVDTSRVGWWAMAMKESQNGANIVPPKYVFDPAVTPPSQCKQV